MKKHKWYGLLFAAFVLFLYGMGIYDLFMMLGHNTAYYASHGYGQEVMEYFTNYPIVFLVLWITNLACGAVSSILYLLKKGSCTEAAFASFLADALLIVLTSIFRNRIGVLGWNVFGFDLFILFVTFCFWMLCRKAWKKQ